MLRILAAVAAIVLMLATPANAEPPPVGFRGPLAYPDGRIPARIACDTLQQVTAVYEAGKVNLFFMRPMADKIARENRNEHGEPACMVGQWGPALVTDRKELGPIVNPVGDAEMVMWAVQVESAKGYRFWILVIDVKTDHKEGTI